MADLIDLSIFPAAVQAYATVGVSIVLGAVGIYGYYKKFRGDNPPVIISTVDANMRELVNWLTKLLASSTDNAHSTKAIEDMIAQRTRQDEIDRAYQKGRDEALDKATAQVAKTLRDKNSGPT